jgi:hypothetical protein
MGVFMMFSRLLRRPIWTIRKRRLRVSRCRQC